MLAVSRPTTPTTPTTPALSGNAIAPHDIETGHPGPVQHQPSPLPAALAGLPPHAGRARNSRGAPPVISACAAASLGAGSSLLLAATGTLVNIALLGENGHPAVMPIAGSAFLGIISLGGAAVSLNEGIKNFRHRSGGHRNGTPPMTPANNAHQALV